MLVSDLQNLSEELQRGAVTIGNFDGVHRGHQRILQKVAEHAQRHDGPSITFTFDPHPVQLLRPEFAPTPLCRLPRKKELLARQNVDALVLYPTNHQLLNLSPRDFFETVIVRQLQARAIVEGPNFFFGKDRAGNVETLRDLCDEFEMELEVVQPLIVADEVVSSSRIRRLLAEGNVELANDLLGTRYRLQGLVVEGAKRGAKLGFPTANLSEIETIVPSESVYGGFAELDGERYCAAIHVGPLPTFDDTIRRIEVHLLDFPSRPLYGCQLTVEFGCKIRGVETFPDADALVVQLRKDIHAIRDWARSDD